jgi:UDP-N-acetylmuramyl tripeptide synthase
VAGAESPHLPPRAVAAVVAGWALGEASRRLRRGGGTALPGVVAGRIDPFLTARLARQLGAGRVLVTGTNGKTTTARMLAGILREAGRDPVHNRSGSNLMRGIGTALLGAAGLRGRISGGAQRAGVFEVDEATLPAAARSLRPSVVVFTNLFRDQLDRYGEVDSIRTLWQRSLQALDRAACVVLNADDPSVAGLADGCRGRVVFYGVDAAGSGAGAAGTGAEHAADARWCHACGAEYVYAPIYFGHIGLWRCPGCDRRRPDPHVQATRIAPAPHGGQEVDLAGEGGSVHLSLPLDGLYNVYNAVAAFAGALALGVDGGTAAHGLAGFSAAFGRQERVAIDGRRVHVLLCKNPAGMNQALATVLAHAGPLHLLVALNDGVQDGRDVSWIWDVDFELLVGRLAAAVATGTRAADMALRLKYAGLDGALALEPAAPRALDRALATTPPGGDLFVLPTYTAMMRLRELIAARGGSSSFWNQ